MIAGLGSLPATTTTTVVASITAGPGGTGLLGLLIAITTATVTSSSRTTMRNRDRTTTQTGRGPVILPFQMRPVRRPAGLRQPLRRAPKLPGQQQAVTRMFQVLMLPRLRERLIAKGLSARRWRFLLLEPQALGMNWGYRRDLTCARSRLGVRSPAPTHRSKPFSCTNISVAKPGLSQRNSTMVFGFSRAGFGRGTRRLK